MAKLKGSNPADAFRKAQRAKELKKNKESRKAARESQTVKRDTRELETEIRQLKALSKPSEGHQARLHELEGELAYVNRTKEAYVKAHPEARDRVFKQHGSRHAGGAAGDGEAEEDARSHLYDEQGRLRDPKRSVYYHETYNPFGVPPPGMPYRERTPSPEPDSDEDEEEDSDDEIIMPSGPAPAGNEDEDTDDSDDIPLPAGPPPPRTLPGQMPQQRPPIYMTGPPSHPPGMPFAPPLHGHGHGAGPSRPRPPRGAPNVQDPLSDGPTQTYQGYRADRANLPPRPKWGALADPEPSSASATIDAPGAGPGEGANLPPRPAPPPRKPLTEGAGQISAEPQLRDLRKEATAFVPRGVKKKASTATAAGPGVGGRINAAPGAGAVDDEGDSIKYPTGPTAAGNGLMGVLKGVLSDAPASAAGKKETKGDLDDDYQKFLEGLGDIA